MMSESSLTFHDFYVIVYWFDARNIAFRYLDDNIHLVGLSNCLRQSQFVICQLGCSVLPPTDAKEILAVESKCKNISIW